MILAGISYYIRGGCKNGYLLFMCVFYFGLHFSTNYIGVTLVNKNIYVSAVQFYETSSVYGIVCLPAKVNLLCHHTFDPLPFPDPSSTLPSGTHHTVSVFEFLLVFSCLFICCLQFYIPYMNEIIRFLTFPDLFHSA